MGWYNDENPKSVIEKIYLKWTYMVNNSDSVRPKRQLLASGALNKKMAYYDTTRKYECGTEMNLSHPSIINQIQKNPNLICHIF